MKLRVDDLLLMEKNIPLILCKLKGIFFPSFFNVMEHLLIYLPYEAKMCRLVQFRWIYPFEKLIRSLK